MSRTLCRGVLLVALVLVVTGAVGASATDDRAGTNKLTGCRNTSTGALDQVRGGLLPMGGACGANEVKLSWNKQGPKGEPGVSGYEQVQTAVLTSESMVTQSVTCPVGKKVVGGGYYFISASGYAVESYPLDYDTWLVKAYKTAGPNPWGLSVFAICVTALP
jgi:hypothetical protein